MRDKNAPDILLARVHYSRCAFRALVHSFERNVGHHERVYSAPACHFGVAPRPAILCWVYNCGRLCLLLIALVFGWLVTFKSAVQPPSAGFSWLFHFTFAPLLLLALPPQSSSHCYTRYIVLSWGLTTLQSLSLCPRRTAHFIYPPSRLILLFNGPLIYILHFSPRLHLVLSRNSSPSQPIYSPIS